VWNGKAEQTAGGLKKDDLIKNKNGRIVSAKKNATMKNVYKGSDSDSEEPKRTPEDVGFWNFFK